MYRIRWQEFNRKAQIITKRKRFWTKNGMRKFIRQLRNMDNYWQIIEYGKEA